MSNHDLKNASTTPGLPISLGIGPVLEKADIERHPRALDRRSLLIGALCIGLALVMTPVARGLTALIGLITNLAFYQRVSFDLVSPAGNHLGLFLVAIPVIGSVIVGLMARYGAKAIRGHGIPEAMEQILTNDSRIPVRMTFLKPLSAAIAIGTGGPFGAEGPIIATGGALGSLLGQLIHVTAHERKTLLAAGAAAGVTAIFGTPFSAILLAIELLVFEFRPRSFIPIALAALTAIILRPSLFGTELLFHIATFAPATPTGLIGCAALGAVLGLFASVLFALEITQQFNTLLPLLAGCCAAFMVSAFVMKTTIMTEKLVRRGHHVPSEYTAASPQPVARP